MGFVFLDHVERAYVKKATQNFACMLTNPVSAPHPTMASTTAKTVGLDHHEKLYRSYQWRQVIKTMGVIAVGLVGLFFLSLVMLVK